MSIILISGKMQSGKDTVAKIWQWLSSVNTHIPFAEWKGSEYDYFSDWEVKHWADKVKEVCALITGTKVEQWNDEKFKSSYLPIQWDKWGIQIYNEHDHPHVCCYYSTFDEAKAMEAFYYSHRKTSILKVRMTPRLMLQLVGTDCFRDIIHPNTWVNALLKEYQNSSKGNGDGTYSMQIGEHTITQVNHPIFDPNLYPNWLIPDTRFPNELTIPKDKFGAKSIRVERVRDLTVNYKHFCDQEHYMNRDEELIYMGEKSFMDWTTDVILPKHLHASETSLDKATFDYTIRASNIEELIEQTKEIMIKEEVI